MKQLLTLINVKQTVINCLYLLVHLLLFQKYLNMKTIVLAMMILPVSFLHAQIKEGKITYEQKVDMYRRIPADNVQIRSMIAPTKTSQFELSFAENQSVFKSKEEEKDIADQESNGPKLLIRIGGSPDDVTYKNFSTMKEIDEKELAGTTYLVEGELNNLTWKLEEGTKNILGFKCKKATGKTIRGSDVEAWYTEDIQVSSGPDQFGGLPGMILSLDINKGEIVYTAANLDKKINMKDIKAPIKGKKVSMDEFMAIQKKEMGNGGMKMVTK